MLELMTSSMYMHKYTYYVEANLGVGSPISMHAHIVETLGDEAKR